MNTTPVIKHIKVLEMICQKGTCQQLTPFFMSGSLFLFLEIFVRLGMEGCSIKTYWHMLIWFYCNAVYKFMFIFIMWINRA